jgi:hypothetical protein
VPPDHRFRRDDDEGFFPLSPELTYDNPEQLIEATEL